MKSTLVQHRLYTDLSYLWPIISPPEEYAEEAEYWRRALSDNLEGDSGTGRPHILELGVGGGHNLSHLTQDFQATAVDLSPQMLSLSTSLNPGVEHVLGDMRSVRLEHTFDAVLVHDGIVHMLSEEDLRAAFTTAQVHLRPKGLLLVGPEWVRETFPGPKDFRWTRKKDGVAVSIKEYLHDPDPADTTIESVYTYTIKRRRESASKKAGTGGYPTRSLQVETDTHVTGLFPQATWIGLLEEAGFRATQLERPENRGGYGGLMFLGVLRGT